MQGRGTVRPPLGIAFEGDLGQRIDAVLAVSMLYGLAAKGEARNIALCVSRTSIPTAQMADAIAGVYTARPVGGSAMIGMPETGPAAPSAPLATAVLSRKNPEGTPAYSSNIARVLDTADNAVLIRNMLLAQNDQNAAIVVAGPLTGLARLVSLYGAKPQIATKCRLLVVAVGGFPTGQPDPSLTTDIAAARTLFAEWPTPIVAVGAEVGVALPYPGATIDKDFVWSQAPHPVVDAYRSVKPVPYDAPASALAAMLYAAHEDDNYFTRSDPGTIRVLDDGRTEFVASANGKHRYLIADAAQAERVTKFYKDMVTAMPAPRGGRGRGGPPPAAVAPPQPPPAAPKPAEVKPAAPR